MLKDVGRCLRCLYEHYSGTNIFELGLRGQTANDDSWGMDIDNDTGIDKYWYGDA